MYKWIHNLDGIKSRVTVKAQKKNQVEVNIFMDSELFILVPTAFLLAVYVQKVWSKWFILTELEDTAADGPTCGS